MRAELGLPSVKGDDEHGGGMTGGFGGSMGGAGQGGKGKRPINVKFEIPYFTTSGIQVRYLKIIEPKVSPRARCPPVCHSFVDQSYLVFGKGRGLDLGLRDLLVGLPHSFSVDVLSIERPSDPGKWCWLSVFTRVVARACAICWDAWKGRRSFLVDLDAFLVVQTANASVLF